MESASRKVILEEGGTEETTVEDSQLINLSAPCLWGKYQASKRKEKGGRCNFDQPKTWLLRLTPKAEQC